MLVSPFLVSLLLFHCFNVILRSFPRGGWNFRCNIILLDI